MKEGYVCENKEPAKLYRIGMFANMNHVTVKALRYYDEENLLKPACVDENTGYRYYSLGQLPVLHQILALRQMEFSVEEIRQIQNGTSEQQLLLRKKQQLLTEIAEKTERLAQVESYLSEEELDTNYHILVKELPEVIVATMQRQIPDYGAFFDIMPAMGAEMERLGCVCALPEYCFTIYLDGGYREEDIHVLICEAVTEKKEDSELIKFQVLPRVEKAACLLHKGPYIGFPQAYAKVLRYVEENGYRVSGPPRESYIDGVWNKDSQEDWLSEIQFPIERI